MYFAGTIKSHLAATEICTSWYYTQVIFLCSLYKLLIAMVMHVCRNNAHLGVCKQVRFGDRQTVQKW